MSQQRESPEILIVDNDARIVELVSWFLTKRGYAVRSAASFAEARELLRDGHPDLMLSDVDLGAENALEELPRMAAEGCLPPTLVVSGYLDADSTRRLEGLAGVRGTLAKPFDFPVLEERVAELLRKQPGAPGAGALSGAGSHAPAPAPDDEGWIEITPAIPRPSAAAGGAAPAAGGRLA